MRRTLFFILPLFLLTLSASGWLVSCDRIPELPGFESSQGRKIRMVVVNEGLFTTNTAALSAIYEDGEVLFDVFRMVNRRPLGDVAQSVTLINGRYFVAVNNSRRIEILDPETFRSIGTIRYRESGSPRYIAPLTDSTAFVSDLYGQMVLIRTRPPYEEQEYLRLPIPSASIEKMTAVSGKVFGAYLGQGIAVFDAADPTVRKMRLIEEVVPTENTRSCGLHLDRDGNLRVLTFPTRKSEQTRIELHCIDPASEKVTGTVTVPFVTDDRSIRRGDVIGMPSYNYTDMNAARDRLYFLLRTASRDGSREDPVTTVFALDVQSGEVAKVLDLPGVQMAYGMAVSPTGDLCICDCLDYTARRGYVRVYRPGVGEVASYKVGVYPNGILFPAS